MHLIRPVSPKSPVASGSAFDSVEESEEEDNLTDASKLDPAYLDSNGTAVSFHCIHEVIISVLDDRSAYCSTLL